MFLTGDTSSKNSCFSSLPSSGSFFSGGSENWSFGKPLRLWLVWRWKAQASEGFGCQKPNCPGSQFAPEKMVSFWDQGIFCPPKKNVNMVSEVWKKIAQNCTPWYFFMKKNAHRYRYLEGFFFSHEISDVKFPEGIRFPSSCRCWRLSFKKLQLLLELNGKYTFLDHTCGC